LRSGCLLTCIVGRSQSLHLSITGQRLGAASDRPPAAEFSVVNSFNRARWKLLQQLGVAADVSGRAWIRQQSLTKPGKGRVILVPARPPQRKQPGSAAEPASMAVLDLLQILMRDDYARLATWLEADTARDLGRWVMLRYALDICRGS
jgi:hypothetical protein